MNKNTLAFKVPSQTELRFPLRGYEQPHSMGEGLRSNGRPTNGAPSPAPAAATTTTSAPGGPNSGNADLRVDAAARRPLPMPKLVRQGRAEGRRVGGQSVAGPSYHADGRTSSSCRGRRRRCRCFGSDRTPGVAPQGVFRSRTVLTTVAKWFVPIARETMDKIYRFGPLRNA
jgi:hypothetical protein